MGLTIRAVLEVGRRWWWLLIGLPLLLGLLAVGMGAQQTPMYASSVTLQVGAAQRGDAADYNNYLLAEGMAETYQELVTIQSVLEPVADALVPENDRATFQDSITVSRSAGTLLTITAADPDAEASYAIAINVAAQFITYTDEQAETLLGPQKEQADERISELTEQLGGVDDQIAALDSDAAGDQAELTALQTERELLQEDISAARRASQTLEDRMSGNAGYVHVVDWGAPPSSPYAPQVPAYAVLGGTLGLLLASGVIFLAEQLNDRVRRSTDMVSVAGVPRVATIPAARGTKRGPLGLYALNQPNHKATEALRVLRSMVRHSDSGTMQSVTVCSPRAGDGVTSITANLAVLLARSGVTVLLVDANFKEPNQHRLFEVNNEKGLGTLLDDPWANWLSMRVPVLQNLHVLPSGPTPDGASELLDGGRFEELLDRLSSAADVVLIDVPAFESSADVMAVAAHTEATLVVCRDQRTRIPQLQQLMGRLNQVGANVTGVVVNHGSREAVQPIDTMIPVPAHAVNEDESPAPSMISYDASERANDQEDSRAPAM